MITLHPHNRKVGVRRKFIVTQEHRKNWRKEQMHQEAKGAKPCKQ